MKTKRMLKAAFLGFALLSSQAIYAQWLITGQLVSTPLDRIGPIGAFPFRMITSNQERMRIAPNGSVGIGTTNPVFKLDVFGNGRYTGPLTIGAYTLPNIDGSFGQVLKTNGLGILTWQNDNNATYTAGSGININGSNVISNTAPDQVVSITGGGATTVGGTYPNFTVSTPLTNITGSGGTTVTGLYPNFNISSLVYTGGTGINVTGTTIANTAPDQLVTLSGSGATTVGGTYPNFTVSSTDNNTTYNAGSGINIDGTNTISNTAPDQLVTLSGSGATTVGGTYPNFTVSSTDNNTTYTAGSGINIDGSNTISNTAPDQLVTLSGSGATTVGGTYPNFTVSSTDNNTTYTAGTGININGSNVVSNTAPDQLVTLTGTGSTSISGTYPNFTIFSATGGGSSPWAISGSNIYNTNTANVGIGNTNPLYKLDVNGDINTPNVYRIEGKRVLAANDAYRSIFVGANAGIAHTTGPDNAFLGHQAGIANTTGGGNVFVGASTGRANINGNYNSFVGTFAGYANTTAAANTFLGSYAGFSNTTGEYNTFLGYQAGENSNGLTNATAIGYHAEVTASNCMVLGIPTGRGNDVHVGIGLTAPTHQLQLSTDDAAKPGSNTWIIASDRRLKKDISSFNDGLSTLKKINPIWFNYNGEAGLPSNKKFVGIIAQEIKEVAPYMISTFKNKDKDGNENEYLAYDGNALPYILVNSIKEQQQIIDEQKALLDELQTRIIALEAGKATAVPVINNGTGATSLSQNAPNPFERYTTISYELKEAGAMELTVYSLSGAVIKKLASGNKDAGSYNITWDAEDVVSGTYLYLLKVNGQEIVKKAICKK